MSDAPPVRLNARVLAFDAEGRLLLFRCEDDDLVDPRLPEARNFWCTPGGGVEPGETPETAALRELAEETGLNGGRLGRCRARRRVTFLFKGRPVLYDEHYFDVRFAAREPRVTFERHEDYERQRTFGWRWWRLDELAVEPLPLLPFGLIDVARAALADPDGDLVWLEGQGTGRAPSARWP